MNSTLLLDLSTRYWLLWLVFSLLLLYLTIRLVRPADSRWIVVGLVVGYLCSVLGLRPTCS